MPTFKAEKGHGVLFYNMQLPLMEKASADQGGVNMIVFGDYLPLYSNGILVSDVVKQAVAGKDFAFEDRGLVELKGFEEPVRAI